MATGNVAKRCQLDGGLIEVGCPADLIILDRAQKYRYPTQPLVALPPRDPTLRRPEAPLAGGHASLAGGQSQDTRQDAYDLRTPVYGWFTGGYNTADLQEAKAWRNELS